MKEDRETKITVFILHCIKWGLIVLGAIVLSEFSYTNAQETTIKAEVPLTKSNFCTTCAVRCK